MMLFMLICFLSIYFQTDYLNEQEIDRVREAQDIDKRTEVFLRIADRRLDALLGVKTEPHKKKREGEDYGPEPTGSREQLLLEYIRIFEEMMDKIDDAFERRKSPALDKAMKILAEGCRKQRARLEVLSARIDDETERRLLEKALDTIKTAEGGVEAYK
ncbi:MAG: hypothetical protein QW828_08260 [Candidatus Bathyarchaeia archaeon]